MPTEPRIENYLASLERALRPLPVSDRAEIVTEIKSHILSALERDPQQNADQVLQALGEPEIVANRYLMERGQAPVKPPISPIVKWLVVGFLGTVAMVLLFAGTLIWRFGPLLTVDEKNDHVSILGGMIDVRGHAGRIDGSRPIPPDEKRPVEIRMPTGKIVLGNADRAELAWKCQGDGQPSGEFAESPQALLLDFSRHGGVRCEIQVPEKMQVRLEGGSGKVSLERLHYNADIRLGTGKVTVEPDPAHQYRYDVAVRMGKTDRFESSTANDAHEIKVNLQTGKVSLSSDEKED